MSGGVAASGTPGRGQAPTTAGTSAGPSGNARFPDYLLVRERPLTFDPVDATQRDVHQLRGLAAYGPYSAALAPSLGLGAVRLGLVCIRGDGQRLRDFLNSLTGAHTSDAKSGYFPPFRGFEPVFRERLEVPQRGTDVVVTISREQADAALAGPEPERRFLELLDAALNQLALRRAEFDVAAIYFPDRLAPIFKVRHDDYDFDLHDATKALAAGRGIPSQIVRDRAIDYPDRCSVLWSLGTALFAKAGGIPWKLADAAPRVAFVGLSYVLQRYAGGQRVVTCCSQVFDDRGHGLQFLLFTADDFLVHGRTPYLKRADMRRLLTKTLQLYVDQAGALPDRLVVHKTTPFHREERDGAADAFGPVPRYELLHVQEENGWSAVKGAGGKPANFPVDRGIALPISKYSFLLWTKGDVPGIGAASSFYQEQKGIPAPLLVTQEAGSGPLEETAAELAGLTKMNWNTGRLYNDLPVTLRSGTALGRIAKYLPHVRQLPYEFRLFM